ncbi:MAG TPA: hypothetical protein VNS58_07185 [Puia sp.]|nr:hypothetical protein [Puia sp.]
MNSTEIEKLSSFGDFMDHYSLPIYSTIAILTGLTDQTELEKLSVATLTDLWKNNDLLFSDRRPTAFIYKIVLKHVFTWLKDKGNTGRIELLKNTLLIDPVHYKHILES